MTKPTKCPYCDDEFEDDDEYNEHLVTCHPEEFDVDVTGGEDD